MALACEDSFMFAGGGEQVGCGRRLNEGVYGGGRELVFI